MTPVIDATAATANTFVGRGQNYLSLEALAIGLVIIYVWIAPIFLHIWTQSMYNTKFTRPITKIEKFTQHSVTFVTLSEGGLRGVRADGRCKMVLLVM